MNTAETDGADDWARRVLETDRFQTKEGKRAPYKPLLLLWLIGRVANGEGISVTFARAEDDVGRLLASHSVAATPPQAKNPFVYLASDVELWSVRNSAGEDIRSMPQNVRENTKYLRAEAIGQLAPRFAAALGDADLREGFVNELLRSEFPETTHSNILAEVGLGQHIQLASAPRDPKFQRAVPMAYEFRCSFCEFGAQVRGEHVGLDAAHVRMHSKAGPSTVDNGVLLCALHHRLFDKGALGIDEHHRILVSQQLTIVDSLSNRSLLDLSGRRMRLPQHGYDPPAIKHVEWHHENLFKKPARALA
ncbi:phosphorothioated DNA-binding restriction endonuclease [Candidatus Poriferisodalis sp.]|uniref:phosphorothioated DNA-binding restriction endonuclease n=1 Tax=Candidatus Poriferisodalis sp. TaxID=3101277 RepID=UPI003C6FA34B